MAHKKCPNYWEGHLLPKDIKFYIFSYSSVKTTAPNFGSRTSPYWHHELKLVKVRKSNFLKKQLFSRWRDVATKISNICYNQVKIIIIIKKKMRIKRLRNIKHICFVKTILNRMECFVCKKCSKLAINTWR